MSSVINEDMSARCKCHISLLPNHCGAIAPQHVILSVGPSTFQASLEAVHKNIDEEARQLLKPSVDDLYHCLERLNSPEENRLARKMLDDYTNCLRLKIAESNPRKRDIENVQMVIIMVLINKIINLLCNVLVVPFVGCT
jgi:hypothetical protein